MRLLYLLMASALLACGGGEATRVTLDVTTRALSTTPVQSDLGYTVLLQRARIGASNLEFTIQGEEHASLWQRAAKLIMGTAHAHPGHAANGEVTGELPGSLLLDFSENETPLGSATLLAGDYHGANFSFRRDDALGGTAFLEGTASRDGRTIAFTAKVNVEEGGKLTGAPFELNVSTDSKETLQWGLLPGSGSVTLFDLIDFAALDSDQDGRVELSADSTEGNVLRRALQSHSFYEVTSK